MRKENHIIRYDAQIKNAIRYAVLIVGLRKSGKFIPHETVTKIFGRHDTAMGKILRKLIMLSVKHTIGKHNAKYEFSPYGLEAVCEQLHISKADLEQILDITHTDGSSKFIADEYIQELETNTGIALKINQKRHKTAVELLQEEFDAQLCTGEFEYDLIKNRRYNHLVQAPKAVRKEVLYRNGYMFDYDINTAVLSLLYQKINKIQQSTGSKFDLSIIKTLITNKQVIREYISEEFNITIKAAKQVMNAVIFGAPISKSTHATAVSSIIGKHQIDKLNDLLGDAVVSIRDAWKFISGGKHLNGSQRAINYAAMEYEVQRSIQKYMSNENHRVLFIHDGFVTDKMVDMHKFNMHLQSDLGFDSMFDMSIDAFIDSDNRIELLDKLFSNKSSNNQLSYTSDFSVHAVQSVYNACVSPSINTLASNALVNPDNVSSNALVHQGNLKNKNKSKTNNPNNTVLVLVYSFLNTETTDTVAQHILTRD